MIEISYDLTKDASNKKKHGVSLVMAAQIDWLTALEEYDDRNDYGEDRYRAVGFIGERLYFVAFTDRGEMRHIISLRKATAREVRDYVERN
jgi:uncharacterized DUF497 family protein